MMDSWSPHKGITCHKNEQGILVVKLHYSADEAKDAEWVAKNKPKSPSEEWWNQEQEIDFGARQGARVYHNYKDDETQLVDPFPVPLSWTRYFCLDPHPRVPHAMLWAAMSPDGYLYVYRELWPSKIYGTNKNIPEDDNVYPIRHYVEAIKELQSANNPENLGEEKIFRQLIDYAARGFGKDQDNPDAMNYQERYEHYAADVGLYLRFEDCVKDNEAAYAEVNEWLRPRASQDSSGNICQRAKVRIFRTGWWEKDGKKIFFQGCPELRWEFIHNRIKILMPHQVDTRDPEMKIIQKRNHVADDLKYIIQSQPFFYKPTKQRSTWKQAYKGVGY